jgi:oligopeptide/dipeptide ABC transporter ATP-binding protein
VGGSIRFRNRDVLALSEKELEAMRGAEISMIFQEPDLALNPFMHTLNQVEEVIAAHRGWNRGRCREEARRVLADVRLNKDPHLQWAYPHQLSGGERQRLVIAQALACGPAFLIADEPTAALDSVLQAEWLALIKDLRQRMRLGLLLITHDPLILAGLADRVLVMYAGQIIEDAGFEEIIRHPLHPYTEALLRSMPPPPGTAGTKGRLPSIATGSQWEKENAGCAFEPCCPDRMPVCSQRDPPEVIASDLRRVRCFKYVE